MIQLSDLKVSYFRVKMQNFFILSCCCPRWAESFSILDVNFFKNEFILFVIAVNFSQTMITFFAAPFLGEMPQWGSIYYVKVFWGISEAPTPCPYVGTFSLHMCGSCHIQCVLISVKYWNLRWTLDVYFLFAILLGQIYSKLNYRLLTYKLARP